jgi:uncharacterized membrane protein
VGRVPLTGEHSAALSVADEATDRMKGEPGILVQRGGWTLVWFAVLTTGLGFWSAWTSWPGAAALAPLFVLAGLIGIIATWLVADPFARALQYAGLGAAVFAVGLPQAIAIHVRRYYTTDSAAFNQFAARVLLHGKNPYTTSMGGGDYLLNPPSHFWTYMANGNHVTQYSYPAASFLLEIPARALGFHHELADWTDLVAWLATGLLLFLLLPASLRWLAALVFMAGAFVGTFSAGGTDALFIPFLVVAVWRWDRFGTGRAAGLANWIGPVALGLACAVKQTPWFCLPLLLIGLGIEARRRGEPVWRVPARYLALAVGVFAACNLPFIVWGAHAWLDGVLLPFTKPLVADGQGLVTLSIHGLTGGVVMPLLSVAGALAYVALLAAFVIWYPAMKVVWLLVLPIVLLVPARSFSGYLIDLFPAALVAALTVSRMRGVDDVTAAPRLDTGTPARRWAVRAAVGIPAVASAAVCALAFTSAPLDLTVVGVRTSHKTLQLDSVTVTVHNSSGQRVTPRFMVVLDSSHPSGFWTLAHRKNPLMLESGASATVTLEPQEYTWSPAHGDHWLVEAYTTPPDALSTSAPQMWRFGKPR